MSKPSSSQTAQLPTLETPTSGDALSPGRDLVQQHLDKVIVSAGMRRSKKLCQFLRFTVEEVLRGHGSELKEYAIGVGVFRRGREFDTGADPIVRVQARRLRAKLEQYYRGEGSSDPLRINIPVGSYSPVFVKCTPAIAAVVPTAPHGPIPEALRVPALIAVLPFIGGEGSEAFSEGLTDELIHALSSVESVRVAARSSCFQFKGRSEDVRRIGESLGVSAVLSGSVRVEGSQLRVLAQLVDTQTGMNIWSRAYDRELERILSAQQEISQDIAGIVRFQFPIGEPEAQDSTTP